MFGFAALACSGETDRTDDNDNASATAGGAHMEPAGSNGSGASTGSGGSTDVGSGGVAADLQTFHRALYEAGCDFEERCAHINGRRYVNRDGNGFETIRIGTGPSAYSDSNTRVENNLFERTDGEVETVSVKSGGNVIRANTFREVAGTITLRRGSGKCRLLEPTDPQMQEIGDARQVVVVMYVYRRGELVWRGPGPYR